METTDRPANDAEKQLQELLNAMATFKFMDKMKATAKLLPDMIPIYAIYINPEGEFKILMSGDVAEKMAQEAFQKIANEIKDGRYTRESEKQHKPSEG